MRKAELKGIVVILLIALVLEGLDMFDGKVKRKYHQRQNAAPDKPGQESFE